MSVIAAPLSMDITGCLWAGSIFSSIGLHLINLPETIEHFIINRTCASYYKERSLTPAASHTVHRVCLLLRSFGAAVLNITCSRLHNLKCWFSKLAVERCSVRQKRHSCQYTVLCVCVRKCTCLYVCNRGATRVNMPSPHLCFVWGYFPATNLTFWCLSTLSVHHPRDPPGCY